MPEISSGSPQTQNPAPTATISTDVDTIRHLVRLMHRYDLTAIDLVEGETQIRLRRRNAFSPPHSAAAPMMTMPWAVPPPGQPQPQPQPPASAPAPEPAVKAPSGLIVESPMVGTFYASGSPDTPPFISVGSAVRENTTVCVIEAMKVFTDIPAGVNGVVAEVLVKNGQSVEFGTPLFRVDPA